MTDGNTQTDKRRAARALAEQALHLEQSGDREKAEALFAQAERIDPDATLVVLQERSPPAGENAAAHGRTGPAASFGIALTVNGHRHNLMVDARTTLLDALRDRLHLTGTKRGCDLGQCGACTVLLDGRRVTACLVFAVMADGCAIDTIEGLARNGELHAMQQAFIDADAFQCGYCTPGQIMSAIGLIREGKATSEGRIRAEMSGNICRCGAYPGIVEAIRDVAAGQSAVEEA